MPTKYLYELRLHETKVTLSSCNIDALEEIFLRKPQNFILTIFDISNPEFREWVESWEDEEVADVFYDFKCFFKDMKSSYPNE